jgi:hypothetical protein
VSEQEASWWCWREQVVVGKRRGRVLSRHAKRLSGSGADQMGGLPDPREGEGEGSQSFYIMYTKAKAKAKAKPKPKPRARVRIY